MAQKRMFDLAIVDSDNFLDMSLSAQALYFHLGMHADDDGFVSPRKIMRMLGSSNDDLKILVAKSFVLPFEDGVVVITHWKINNTVRTDRYKPSIYQNHLKSLKESTNKAYALGIPNGNQMETQYSIVKYSIEERENTHTLENSEEQKKIKSYSTVKTFLEDKEEIIKQAEEMYVDRDCRKAWTDFEAYITTKNSKYKNFKLAFLNWVRTDRFNQYYIKPKVAKDEKMEESFEQLRAQFDQFTSSELQS